VEPEGGKKSSYAISPSGKRSYTLPFLARGSRTKSTPFTRSQEMGRGVEKDASTTADGGRGGTSLTTKRGGGHPHILLKGSGNRGEVGVPSGLLSLPKRGGHCIRLFRCGKKRGYISFNKRAHRFLLQQRRGKEGHMVGKPFLLQTKGKKSGG